LDQLPIRKMSPIAAPLPKADKAVVAHVEPGGASMPASRRLLMMNPLKVLRVTIKYRQQAFKKRWLCRMSRASLASTGQRDSSSVHDLRQMGGPMCPALSVLERYAGTSCTKLLEICRCLWSLLRLKSSMRRLLEMIAKMKAHFLTSWAQLRGRGMESPRLGLGPRLMELCGEGAFFQRPP
jgi:hypothetical protein